MKKSLVREALPKPNILQLSQYDITQKIMDSLVNTCHRSVLFSIVKNAKDATQISDELNIKEGDWYSAGKIEKSVANISDKILKNGQPFGEVIPQVD